MKKYLLFLIFLTWPFGLLLSFSLPFLGKPIYFLDIFVGLLFLVNLADKKKWESATKDPLFKPLIFFDLCLLLSLLFNIRSQNLTELVLPAFYLLRVLVYPTLYFSTKSINKNLLFQLSLLSTLMFIAFGLVQYLFLPDLRFLKYLGHDDHFYRLVGTLLDPNFTGALLSAISLIFIYFNQYFLLLISLVSLALTFSRASYLSFLVGIVLYAIIFKKYKAILVVCILSLVIFLSPKPFGEGVNLLRTFSIFSRLENINYGLTLFTQKPLLGWGYNTLNTPISNSFVSVLATSGIVGFIAFLNLIKTIFIKSKKLNVVILTTLLVHSLFNNTFFFIWVMAFFWVTLQLKE